MLPILVGAHVREPLTAGAPRGEARRARKDRSLRSQHRLPDDRLCLTASETCEVVAPTLIRQIGAARQTIAPLCVLQFQRMRPLHLQQSGAAKRFTRSSISLCVV